MATAMDLASQWREQRALRLAKQKEVEALTEVESDLKKQLIARLNKSVNKALSTNGRLIQLVTKDEPVVEDWSALYKHLQKTGEFDLLEKRLGKKAAQERFEDGKKIPGVGTIPVDTISDTKAK